MRLCAEQAERVTHGEIELLQNEKYRLFFDCVSCMAKDKVKTAATEARNDSAKALEKFSYPK